MKNTLCFKKELYVVVVKVRAIVLRKIQQTDNELITYMFCLYRLVLT